MFFQQIRAEWIKLHTTKSFYWTTFLFFLVFIGFAAISGMSYRQQIHEYLGESSDVESLVLSMINPRMLLAAYPLAVLIVAIQMVMLVTTEYRFGTTNTTFVANPHRATVACAKWLLYAVVSVIYAIIGVVCALFVGSLCMGSSSVSYMMPFSNDASTRLLWVIPVMILVSSTIAFALGLLVRQTAGTIVIYVIWSLMLENFLGLIPHLGEKIEALGPFTNMNNFYSASSALTVSTGEETTTTIFSYWNMEQWGLLYAAVWAVVLFIVGVVVLQRRDA